MKIFVGFVPIQKKIILILLLQFFVKLSNIESLNIFSCWISPWSIITIKIKTSVIQIAVDTTHLFFQEILHMFLTC